MINWENEKTTLETLISCGVPYEEIGRKYNVTGAAIKKAAKKLGIEIKARRKINPCENFSRKRVPKTYICMNCGKVVVGKRNCRNKFCSNVCQQEYYYKEFIKRWKNGEEKGMSGEYSISSHIKRYLFEKNDCKCEICGWGEVNAFTGKVPLEVHHKDGDYTNNKEENLQLLCPNCHALTETFKSHNKNGRKSRKKYYNE